MAEAVLDSQDLAQLSVAVKDRVQALTGQLGGYQEPTALALPETARIAKLQASMEARLLALESQNAIAMGGNDASAVQARIEEEFQASLTRADIEAMVKQAAECVYAQMQEVIDRACREATEREILIANFKAAVESLTTMETVAVHQQRQIESEMKQRKLLGERCSEIEDFVRRLNAQMGAVQTASKAAQAPVPPAANSAQPIGTAWAPQAGLRRSPEVAPLRVARNRSPSSRTASPFPHGFSVSRGRLSAPPPACGSVQAASACLGTRTPVATPMQMRPVIHATSGSSSTPGVGGTLLCAQPGSVRNSPGSGMPRVASQGSPVPSSVTLQTTACSTSRGCRSEFNMVPAEDMWLKANPNAYMPINMADGKSTPTAYMPSGAAIHAKRGTVQPPGVHQACPVRRRQASLSPSPRGRASAPAVVEGPLRNRASQ